MSLIFIGPKLSYAQYGRLQSNRLEIGHTEKGESVEEKQSRHHHESSIKAGKIQVHLVKIRWNHGGKWIKYLWLSEICLVYINVCGKLWNIILSETLIAGLLMKYRTTERLPPDQQLEYWNLIVSMNLTQRLRATHNSIQLNRRSSLIWTFLSDSQTLFLVYDSGSSPWSF